jgi:hypothetical protein
MLRVMKSVGISKLDMRRSAKGLVERMSEDGSSPECVTVPFSCGVYSRCTDRKNNQYVGYEH